jgi:hypothetical protein
VVTCPSLHLAACLSWWQLHPQNSSGSGDKVTHPDAPNNTSFTSRRGAATTSSSIIVQAVWVRRVRHRQHADGLFDDSVTTYFSHSSRTRRTVVVKCPYSPPPSGTIQVVNSLRLWPQTAVRREVGAWPGATQPTLKSPGGRWNQNESSPTKFHLVRSVLHSPLQRIVCSPRLPTRA